EQILNLAESSRYLMGLVRQRAFKIDKVTFCSLHARVARNEALEWGHFRGEGAETRYTPDILLGRRGLLHQSPPSVAHQGSMRCSRTVPAPWRRMYRILSNGLRRSFCSDRCTGSSLAAMNVRQAS